jgi:hypothetical protein
LDLSALLVGAAAVAVPVVVAKAQLLPELAVKPVLVAKDPEVLPQLPEPAPAVPHRKVRNVVAVVAVSEEA